MGAWLFWNCKYQSLLFAKGQDATAHAQGLEHQIMAHARIFIA